MGHAAMPGSNYLHESNRKLFTELEESSGRSIGMLGLDYAQLADKNKKIDLSRTNQLLIEQWKKGGLVTVSWHARNPWTGNGSRDASIKGKISDLWKPGKKAHAKWMAELDQVAAALAELQNAGVVVIWRPLHESNGKSFWWSKATPEEFRQLWIQVFDYLTKEKKLNNLIWVYSVLARGKEAVNYPGPEYVDMTGLDLYAPGLESAKTSYDKLVALGKPFGLTEYGPYKGSDAKKNPLLAKPHYSYPKLIEEIRSYMPEAVFFQAWNHGHALVNQLDADKLLADPSVTDARDRGVAAAS